MSGIAGQIVIAENYVDRAHVEKMIEELLHRGGDETFILSNKGVCLANCRQKIFDRQEELKWSTSNEDNSIMMVYDGEIYNYCRLRELLQGKGYQFRTNSDAEVIFSLYLEFGIDFINQLDGVYAIVICDFNKNEAYLIRDILGVKPFFYYQKKDKLYFSSEIKALISSGVYDPEIDYFGLKDYLHIQLYLGNKTLFRDISYVGEGHYLKIDLKTGEVSNIQYWEMPLGELDITYNEAVEHLDSLIKKSVKDCCQVDGSLSAYVSGGLDSTVVATLASQYHSKSTGKLITYSSIYPHMDFQDEREMSDIVIANLVSDHHRVVLDTQDMIDAHIDELMYKMDMPEAGYAAPYMLLNRYARKRGNVVLTGNGGDELFAGYPKYIAAMMATFINRSYNGETTKIDSSFIKYIKGFELQFKNILQKAIFQEESELIKSLFYRSEGLWDYIDEEIKRETAGYDVAQEIWEVAKDRPTSFLKKLMYMDQKILLKGLLHIEDRTSSTETICSRSPLLSKDIVEFSARLPETYLLRNGLKSLMRDVAKRHIPYEVAMNKNKSGMIYPVPEFLRKHMSSRFHKDISNIDSTGLFRCPVNKLINLGNEPIYSRKAWGLWCISTWYNSFIG